MDVRPGSEPNDASGEPEMGIELSADSEIAAALPIVGGGPAGGGGGSWAWALEPLEPRAIGAGSKEVVTFVCGRPSKDGAAPVALADLPRGVDACGCGIALPAVEGRSVRLPSLSG